MNSNNFYSQHGEDKWIVDNLHLPMYGNFIEVGAFDGVLSSNTKHFEEIGWTGIVIEPDPMNAEKCRHNRTCTVIEGAIGFSRCRQKFFINPDDRGLSGLMREGNPIDVDLMPLWNFVSMPRHVDLLSVDTEGTELEVWDSIGICRPKIVIMEWNTLGLPPNDVPIVERMTSDGYNEVHRTGCNIIFVHQYKAG